MKRVYIAGPMTTSGEPGPNLNAAACAAAELLKAGHFPFVPHVTWLLHAIRPDVDVKLWLAWDLEWLTSCDAVVRLPGKSHGADLEVALAHKLDLPVYSSVKELLETGEDRREVTPME